MTKNHQDCNCSCWSQNKVHRESKLMNNLLEPALSGQVPSFQSKNWIGNLLKMNYFEFSFRENEISAAKVCMATAGRASDDQEGPGAAGLSHFIELFKLN